MVFKDQGWKCIDDFTHSKVYIFFLDMATIHKDFNILKNHTDGQIINTIYLNNTSLSLLIKSFLFKCPQAIFLSSAINFFQDLRTADKKGPIDYYTCSHALTLYYLKIIERRGIIALNEYTEISDEDFTTEYRIIGNTRPKKEKKSYDIWFNKLRDIDESDLDQIRKIERTFNIPDGIIIYTYKNGKLRAHLNTSRIITSLLTFNPVRQVVERVHNYTKSNGDESKSFKNTPLNETNKTNSKS